jgi:hypothetical protein
MIFYEERKSDSWALIQAEVPALPFIYLVVITDTPNPSFSGVILLKFALVVFFLVEVINPTDYGICSLVVYCLVDEPYCIL